MQQLEMLETTDKRKCSICKEVKEAEAFSLHKIQGRQSQCKECRRKDYQENKERFNAACKKHYQENKEAYRKRSRSYAKNSVKAKAKAAANYAVKTGKLIRQPCEKCGAEKTDAHHDDYAKPLQVRWLCRGHHIAWHAEFGEAPNACTVRHWTPTEELKS